jgi:cytochrome c oxidase subunit III
MDAAAGVTVLPTGAAGRGSSQRTTAANTGVWIAVAAISMSFAAYTSAMVVRQGAGSDWLHFRLPPILYLNTLLIIASSVTLERGRRNHTPGRTADGDVLALPGPVTRTTTWIDVTFVLGLLFLAGQLIAWRQLAGEGLFLATNPSSAFFYILTALHGLHLLGGLGGLAYVRRRLRHRPVLAAGPALGAATRYWHFIALLWLYLLLLLVVRL